MKTKIVKIALDEFGSYLGAQKGCFIVRDKNGNEKKYPMVENLISEITIRSGNCVSGGALSKAAFWGIDCLILTQRGHPIAMLKSLANDDHVETRVYQYRALTDGKGLEIAKQIVLSKYKGQNELLRKYGLKLLEDWYVEKIKALDEKDMCVLRRRLTGYEGKFSRKYFSQIFELFGESFRPERRRTFRAYDGLNNILNLTYRILSWKVHIALIRAKLEPYLGFLHSMEFGLPSLVCDFQELYRHLVDDFVIQYCKHVKNSDFMLKTENCTSSKRGKRQYLNEAKTRNLINEMDKYLKTRVRIPRLTHGDKQRIETLISEEASLFAMYLRNERKTWNPRIVVLE